MENNRKKADISKDMLEGCINRMYVTDSPEEIISMIRSAVHYTYGIAEANMMRLEPEKYNVLPPPNVTTNMRIGICPHCHQGLNFVNSKHVCPNCKKTHHLDRYYKTADAEVKIIRNEGKYERYRKNLK